MFVQLFVLVSALVAVRTIYFAKANRRLLKAPYMLELPQPSEAVTAFLTAYGIEAMLVESAPGMSTHTAAEAAVALGIGSEENRVIKSLVCIAGSGVPLVVLLCGSDRLDLRALSAHMRCRARLATATEALELTGYPIGSIPPFSMLQASTLQAIMDARVLEQPSPVYAGGGQDGLHVCLSPAELQRATRSFVGKFVMGPAPLLSAPLAPPLAPPFAPPLAPPLAPPPPPSGPLSTPWPPKAPSKALAADWWVAPSAEDAAALVRLRDEREREVAQIAADGPL
jgi:prolyl-tRNA editing enzyme YbaK/EbsC (Cys-tRNA(Pro) deacylase)